MLLLGQTTPKKMVCDSKLVWVKNGQIFARKTNAAPTFLNFENVVNFFETHVLSIKNEIGWNLC